MATEATVLHGPLPSAADGSTTSPTPRGGDGKLDDRPLSHTAVSRRSERRERMRDEAEKDKEAYSSDDASVRSSRRRQPSRRSSFPYRDIIKSVLSNIMTKNEEPASSSSPSSSRPSSSQGKEKSDMKDKKVEDVVRGLAMEEWNARWLDELVAKVKGELSDAASYHSVSDGRHTPSSQSSSDSDDDASLKDMKRYQPTVEDYDSDSDSASETEADSQAAAQDEPQPPSRSSSLSSASSADSVMSSPSSQSSVSTAASSPPLTESDSPKDPRASPRPTVHFSPPTIHFLPPEPTPELEREQPDLYQTQSVPSSQLRPPIVSERQVPVVAERQAPPAWGALFNDRDEPTPALGRLLRGLANYIIAEYSPTDSLVITPDKLFKFYTRYKLDNEFFPFQRVFDTRYHKSIRGLSFLYTDLRCEHHLVQESITRKPVIPSLTPAGFEDWMTLLIRAFPDREAKRLDMVLADVPLLEDDRHSGRSPVRSSSSERLLPRQLPRQLFPERGHVRAFALLESSFSEWNSITTVPVPPPEVVPAHPLAYSLSSNIPASLQKLPPAASKALMEDTRRHKDACYIDQTRLRPSSIIYPSSASPTSPSSSSFSTSSSIPADVKSHSEQQPSSSSSSSSKHHHRTSRSKERDSRHRTSDRSSRPRERSPTGRRSHRSRRYRGTSPSESAEQRYSSGRSDERRRERERRGSVAER